ncbi:hypothetical protein pb186bvf_014491 [Paramecium bursaria]
MGCCQDRNQQEIEIQFKQQRTLVKSPNGPKLQPIALSIYGDDDQMDPNTDLQQQLSLKQFHKFQKTISVKDQQKPTQVSETVILDFRRPSIQSPSRPSPIEKSQKNINSKFIGML